MHEVGKKCKNQAEVTTLICFDEILRLTVRQQFSRIHRPAIDSNLEMEHSDPRRAVADLSDFIPGLYAMAQVRQHGAVVGIGTEVTIIVANDDEIAAALHSLTGINHVTVGGGQHQVPTRPPISMPLFTFA